MKRKPKYRLTIADRLAVAETQLRMVQESTGRITEGNVRRAAADWSDDGNEEQYRGLKWCLSARVTA